MKQCLHLASKQFAVNQVLPATFAKNEEIVFNAHSLDEHGVSFNDGYWILTVVAPQIIIYQNIPAVDMPIVESCVFLKNSQ
ncbi:hypothetical protein SDC9_152906 [bioreactor metagenome]|uniref:Uncharacterized protein n=1 Tax=bioreactor metagenome TaxID=1076179 RepID=A0A645EUF4_9ZZZZ